MYGYLRASSNALASWRSTVSEPSVNQPYTGARRARASACLPWCCHRWLRLTAARSSSALGRCPESTAPAGNITPQTHGRSGTVPAPGKTDASPAAPERAAEYPRPAGTARGPGRTSAPPRRQHNPWWPWSAWHKTPMAISSTPLPTRGRTELRASGSHLENCSKSWPRSCPCRGSI